MEKPSKLTTKKVILAIAAIFLVCVCILGGIVWAKNNAKKVTAQEDYGYVNPDETRAEADEGIMIDGVFDEAQYQNNNWLYLHNDEEGMDVDVAMTSWFGDKGIYFAYDVTEKTNIYVNLNRSSALNSGIEMYLVPNYILDVTSNGFFEIDLMPTGDINFKMTNGKGGYVSAGTTDDKMPYLGTTTKGGEVNTKDCQGYTLEFFIPWDYMEWLGLDVDEMKDGFVYVDPVHITSYNIDGTNMSKDRYWYRFATQQGVSFGRIYQFYRFNDNGAMGPVPVALEEGANYSITGDKTVLPGVVSPITITPEQGYTINSILVNGEEYIKKVSYNKDGSVDLKVRGADEGLTVSATAVPEAKGNVTLSGTLIANKYGGGNLSDISIKYKGPRGERPIEFDNKGNFVLPDLKQGFYKITVEKEGYKKLTRNIYLNRDTEIELSLEYEMFEGNAVWIFDDQNNGLIRRFGGGTTTLTKDSYSKFSFESYFRYDTELAKEYEHDFFVEQRQGLRIAFSNEKTWCIDILYQDGQYFVQYGNGQVYKWQSPYTLTQADIDKFTSEEGIKLEVQRDGKYANIYLDDKLIAVEVLDDEFAKCTAKLGLEGWVASRKVMNHPFKITQSTDRNLKNTYFKRTSGWDLSKLYDGIISLTEGGRANLKMVDKMVNMDFTIRVQDNQNSTDKEGTYPRTDLLFVFENGAHISFGVTSDGKSAWVQSMNQSANKVDGKETPYIYPRWTKWYDLTEEEFKQYQNGGVDLRIVRYGTEITLYIGDKMVGVADLTNKDRGVTADMPAEITIRHYDDAGVKIDFPFSIKETFDFVTINSIPNANGKVATEKQTYFVGDTVKLMADKDDYYCTSMKVNGQDVTLNMDGTYSFKATEKNYTVEGTLAKRVFKKNANWNILKQNVGVVSLPNGGNGGMLEFYDKYTDMDLTITAKDYVVDEVVDDKAVYERTDVLYVFENGAGISFGIVQSDNGAIVQTMNHSSHEKIYGNWTAWGTLTEEEFAQYQNGGVKLRLVRMGTEIAVYIGDRYLGVADLTKNNSGVTADTKATVNLRHYDDNGVQVDIPFSVTTSIDKVTVTGVEDEFGRVVAQKKNFFVGDTVILSGEGKGGYYCYDMKVNGQDVTLDWDGTYTFTATEKNYTAEGTFDKQVFKNNKNWGLVKQNEGLVMLPNGGNGGMLEFYDKYTDMDLTITAKDYVVDEVVDGKAVYERTDVLYAFENGAGISFGIVQSDNGAIVQTMNHSSHEKIYGNWTAWGELTKEEFAQYQNGGVELRLVRIGTEIAIYIGDRYLGFADLTNNNSGVTADTKATVYLRHYDDSGVQVEIPFEINTELDIVPIDVADDIEHGQIICMKNALRGEKFTLTVVGDKNYFYDSLKVNGKDVLADYKDGTYTFTATEDSYTVDASFVYKIFNNDANSYLMNQNVGMVVQKSDATANAALNFAKSYTNFDITMKVKGYDLDNNADIDGNNLSRTNIRMWIANQQVNMGIARNTIEGGCKYTVQTMGGDTILPANTDLYTLTDAEIAKYNSADGIEFRVIRKGTAIYYYVDGHWVYTADLTKTNAGADTGITETTECTMRLNRYDDIGHEVEIPITVSETVPTVLIVSSTDENGTITFDKKQYSVGETVTFTVTGKANYFYNSLKVNGEEVVANYKDGTYSFTAKEGINTVEASFAYKTFNNNNNCYLINQNVGMVVQKSNVTKGAELNFAKNWNENYTNFDITMKVKGYDLDADADGDGNNLSRTNIRMWIGSHTVNMGIARNTIVGGCKYTVQTMGGDTILPADTDLYTLTDAEIAKYNSDEGVEFRVIRQGTIINFYVDGHWVYTADLTKTNAGADTGITATTECTMRLNRYDDLKHEVEIPITVSETVPKVIITSSTDGNGTITFDKESYDIGDTVTFTVAGKSNYFYNSLKVNGEEVIANYKDGTYSFTAKELSYNVEASFAYKIFDSNANYYTNNQNVGMIVMSSQAEKNPKLYFAKQYTDFDITMKVKGHDLDDNTDADTNNLSRTNIRMWLNNQTVNLGIARNTITGGAKYTVQTMGNDAILPANTDLYTLTDAEIAKYNSDEGVEFRVIRNGTIINFYVDGHWVYTADLTKTNAGADSGITATTETTGMHLVRYDDQGHEVEIPITVSETVPAQANITSTTDGNGSIEFVHYDGTKHSGSYIVGEKVTFKVVGNDGYFYNSLKIDGVEVDEPVDANGEYTFTATQANHKVEASFAPAIFDSHVGYNVLSQNVGVLRVPASYTEPSVEYDKYIWAKDSYNEITIIAKDSVEGTQIRSYYLAFYINGKRVPFRISNEQGDWEVQSGGGVVGWSLRKPLAELPGDVVAKLQDEGVEFKIVRNGTTVDVYVDGNEVFSDVDITVKSSGITSEMTAKAGIRIQGTTGYETDIKFQLKK